MITPLRPGEIVTARLRLQLRDVFSRWLNPVLSIALALIACGCVAVHPPPDRPIVRVVFGSYCAGIKGAVYPAVCGIGTGLMGVFELSSSDARKAEALGYLPLWMDVAKTTCRL